MDSVTPVATRELLSYGRDRRRQTSHSRGKADARAKLNWSQAVIAFSRQWLVETLLGRG